MDTPPEAGLLSMIAGLRLLSIIASLQQRIEDLERAERILQEQRSKLETECIALRERCERLDYERWRLQREKDKASL